MTSTKPLKFVMLGESKVGKTSIFTQYNEGKFDPDYKPTLSALFLRMEIKISDSNATTLDIWEAPGGKTYRSIAKIYYKETNAFLLVYDEKNNKNNEKEIDIIKQESSNTIINKSIIKNKDNYFKKEQLDYYMNVYLLNHTQEEPKEKLNYKR